MNRFRVTLVIDWPMWTYWDAGADKLKTAFLGLRNFVAAFGALIVSVEVEKDLKCTSSCEDNYCPVHGIEATKKD